MKAVADASGSEDEFELFVSMGLRSRLDSIDTPSSLHERGVRILLLKGECTGVFHPLFLSLDGGSRRRVFSSMV